VNTDKLQKLLERQVQFDAYNRLEEFRLKFRILLEEFCQDYPEIMFRGEGNSSLTISGLSFHVATRVGEAMAEIDLEQFKNGLS
jgi:hypothetical protein